MFDMSSVGVCECSPFVYLSRAVLHLVLFIVLRDVCMSEREVN